jgi:hypothetical protein
MWEIRADVAPKRVQFGRCRNMAGRAHSAWLGNCKQLPVGLHSKEENVPVGKNIHVLLAYLLLEQKREETEPSSASFIPGLLFLKNADGTDRPRIVFFTFFYTKCTSCNEALSSIFKLLRNQ